MRIFVVGLSHKTAPIRIRESIAFLPQKLSKALLALSTYPHIQECVILSTCNRVELYVVSDNEGCVGSAKQFLHEFHRPPMRLEPHLYIYKDRHAIRHLFRVAASLDSMIIGENQILGQVKHAYFAARSCEVVGKTSSVLFEKAIRTGKKVRHQTHIGKGAVSISTAAIELARKAIKTLKGRSVLIVGAGKIGELTVKHLASKGIAAICVANRTYRKAQKLAKKFAGRAIKFSQLGNILPGVDIVISSTSAPHHVIRKETLAQLFTKRTKPLFLIDLGVPRNIEKDTEAIVNVHLYDIDDLMRVREKNLARRMREVKEAVAIVEAAVDHFLEKDTAIHSTLRR